MEYCVERLEQMSKLLTDTLFLAQVESGRATLALEEFSLWAEAMRVAETLTNLTGGKPAAFRVEGEATLVADQQLARRAIAYVMAEAWQAAAPGSEIRVSISNDRKTVRLAVERPATPRRSARTALTHAREATLEVPLVRAIMGLHGGLARFHGHAGEPLSTLEFPSLRRGQWTAKAV